MGSSTEMSRKLVYPNTIPSVFVHWPSHDLGVDSCHQIGHSHHDNHCLVVTIAAVEIIEKSSFPFPFPSGWMSDGGWRMGWGWVYRNGLPKVAGRWSEGVRLLRDISVLGGTRYGVGT